MNIDILIKKDMNRFEGLYNIPVFFLSVEGLHSFYNSTCSLSILSLYISIWICDIEDTIVMKTMKHFFVVENNRINFIFLLLYFKKNEITLAATIFTTLPGCCVPLNHCWFLSHASILSYTNFKRTMDFGGHFYSLLSRLEVLTPDSLEGDLEGGVSCGSLLINSPNGSVRALSLKAVI